MPFLVTLVLVVAVHLVIGIEAWSGVGLLADDHQMIGAAFLRHEDASLGTAFFPQPVPGAGVALYRPFTDLMFWLEYPVFGIEAFGYHVVNSALHIGTAMTWFVLVARVSGSVIAAAAAALLFVGWPGHSEVTHWIAARVSVQSTFLFSVALLVHDVGLGRAGRARWLALVVAAGLAVVAIGSKESAVFVVPVAAVLTWMRMSAESPRLRRAGLVATAMLPMAAAALAWLAWRAQCLGTWGSGSHYGWQALRINADTCIDWLAVLAAPAHLAHVPGALAAAMLALHVALLVASLTLLRSPALRNITAPAATLLLLGYLAGIGLERLDLPALENVRYTYEPALGLCVLLGLGVAALPSRVRIVVLIGVVAVHGFVLDGNRQSWLRVAAVYARMRSDIVDVARATQQPIRVIDAPGVHDGAFGLLNGTTEFRFLQHFAPPGTNLRGVVSSTIEWHGVLHELAAAAAKKEQPANAFTVLWNDGTLAPLVLDPQWPREAWSGVSVAYARIARERPFAGSQLPVHVLVQTEHELVASVQAAVGDVRWSGETVRIAPGERATAIVANLVLSDSLAADVPVAVALRLEQGDKTCTFSLGVVVPSAR